MADAEVSLKIVADVEDIKKSLQSIESKIGDVSSVGGIGIDNLAGKASILAIGFNAVTQAVSFLSEKIRSVTVDLAIVGERAAQVESGFMKLADSAGLAGNELRQSIIDAAQGTIETTDLIRRSSELVVAFGQDAKRIPELIELSRKAARAFGIDSAEAFDRLSEAVRNGSDRALKQLGITIDLDEAKKNYAKTIGVAVNELSREGEATARLNALLDVAGKKFSEVDLSTRTLSESYAAAGTAVGDFIETIGQAITRTGILQNIFNALTETLKSAANGFNILFGTEAQDAAAQIPQLTNALSLLNEELRRIEAGQQPLMSRLFGRSKEDVLKDIEDVSAKLEQMRMVAKGEQFGPPLPPSGGADLALEDKTSKEKRLENERKFQEEINRLRLQEAENAIKLAQDEESLKTAQHDRQLAREQELALKKQEIRNNDALTKQQQDALILEQENLHQQQLLIIRQQEEAEYNAMLQRRLENTSAIDEQIALSAEIRGRQVAESWRKAGGLGGAFVQSFGNRAVSAFQAMGSGAMSASDAVKGAMLGMIADVAANYGKMMMLSSIFPPNPLAFAAGAALVALSGALGARASGSQPGSDVGGGGIGGGFGTPGGFGGPSINEAMEKRREVTINIEGNYFDSEQTRLAIVQAVRDAGDAADFTVQRGNRRSR